MEERNTRKHTVRPQLPQWNSKFSFSAQKHYIAVGEGVTAKEDVRKTPLGQPRRVPIDKEKGAKGTRQAETSRAHASSTACSQVTPGDSDKTPTICLFQRFESLTISTPATGKAGTSAVNKAADPAAVTAVHGGAKPRRSVAFGTPSVLTYTPAEPPAAVQQPITPLWSNAGHTPYSLDGGGAAAGCVRECHTSEQLETSSDGVCMELFTSVITDTGSEQTPAATRTCPKTPADAGGEATTSEASPLPVAAASSAACLMKLAGTPLCAAQSGSIQRQKTNTSGDAAVDTTLGFIGFDTAQKGARQSRQEVSTPPFISKAAAYTSAAVSTGTSTTPGPGCAVHGAGSLRLPAPTPKSKLKQPARVPAIATRPSISSELKQLLGDYAGVTAAVEEAGKLALGGCDILSPVRPKKQQQHTLGAEQQVLTPVRRSARKALKQHLTTDAAHVQPMLEATNYCYQPNEALQELQHQT